MKIALDNTDWVQYHATTVTQYINLKEIEMEIIMTLKFMHSIEKIITEVSAVTGIDEVHAKALRELLKGELNEYCLELEEYYEEEYSNAIASARSKAYDSGYEDGYDTGYWDCNSAI